MANGDLFPTLIQGQRLDPSLINGVSQEALTIGAGRDATVAFQDEIAANQNVLGAYVIDEDGTIRDPKLVVVQVEARPVRGALLHPSKRFLIPFPQHRKSLSGSSRREAARLRRE